MVIFSCFLELWLSCWKCLQAIIASSFFASFRWLFNLILKLVSALPTELFITQNALRQIYNLTDGTINVLEYFLVCWLLKVVVFRICLQQSKVTLRLSGLERICLVLVSVFVMFWLCLFFQFCYFLLAPWGFYFC